MLVLPPNSSFKKFNCPFNILLIFQILKQGNQIAFEIHLSFQNMPEHQLVGSFFLLAVEPTGILLQFFEKWNGLSDGFWKVSLGLSNGA